MKTKKPLKFLHIPKTGGMAVAQAAMPAIKGMSWLDPFFVRKNLKEESRHIFKKQNDIWHIPLWRYREELYQKFDWFCLIRDPIDRAVSSFHCPHSGWHGKDNPYKVSRDPTIEEFNRFVVRGAERQWTHYRKQITYIRHYETGENLIKHVLLYDELPDCVNRLWEAYGITAKMDRKTRANTRKRTWFDRNALTEESEQVLQEIYEEDFELIRGLQSDITRRDI